MFQPSSKMQRRAVAACALFLALPAAAAVNAGATAGPLTVSVVDLRPDDGAAAGVTFAGSVYGARVGATVRHSWPGDYLEHQRNGPWQGTAVDAAIGHAQAQAAVFGGGAAGPQGVALALSGGTTDFTGPAGAAATFNARAALLDQDQMLGFSLAPWSEMTLTFDVSGTMSTARPGDQALLVFELTLNTANGLERFDTFAMFCNDTCSDSNGRLMSVTLPNESASTLDGVWSFSAQVAGGSVASPVPETGSGGLLLSGLAVMGLVARRRSV